MKPLRLHPDRLFPAETRTRDIARALYATVSDLPIISPHGHTDPAWFAYNEPFANPSDLLIVPDHYVFRMLMSQGVALDQLGIPTVDGSPTESDPRAIWSRFAAHYHLFAGTPSRMWLDYVFTQVFGLDVRLEPATAALYYDTIDAALKTRTSAPAPCSSASTSRPSPPPRARSTRCSTTRRSARAAGVARSSPPIAPIR
jgi:glucuronate isomerase